MSPNLNSYNSKILIVEDSDADFDATKRAFERAHLVNPIHRCETGDDALRYLYGKGAYASDVPERPSLILLDLNLPGTDGRDVLAEIKRDEDLQDIPVIILTTSSDERDINDCYQRGANSYIVKPVDFDGFIKSIQRLKEYWYEIVVLPREKKKA